ncbi:hypothetical protein AC1031_012350 [Aphanomyces cochlioides]|nr:hypothetical protein AC1031_012350 [Aphanomyces cochlioides]
MSTPSPPQDSNCRTVETPPSNAAADQPFQPRETPGTTAAPTNASPSAPAESPIEHLQQSNEMQSTPPERTASPDTPLAHALDTPPVPELQVGSTNADGEPCATTTGNSPLLDTVALYARESMPAGLTGATGPSVDGGQASALEPRPETQANDGDGSPPAWNPPITGQKEDKVGASETCQQEAKVGAPEARHRDAPPQRCGRTVDLRDPIGSTVDTNNARQNDTPPISTYASVLKKSIEDSQQSDLKCYLSRPSRSNLQKLIELAENDSTGPTTKSLPYPTRVGTGTFWIETSADLVAETNDKIIRSILNDNKDAPWSSHARLPPNQQSSRRDETDHVGQTVSILGKEYTVSAPRATKNPRNSGTNKQHGLEDLYYMDIVGTRYNFDAHLLLKGLRRLKTNPLYTYKSIYDSKESGSRTHPNIWRVYFNHNKQPSALIVNGLVIDELVLQGIRYGVFVKNYVKQTTPRQGRASQHCIDIDKLLAGGDEGNEQQPQQEEDTQKRQRLASDHGDGIQQNRGQKEAVVELNTDHADGVEGRGQHDTDLDPSPPPRGQMQTTEEVVQPLEMEVDDVIQPNESLKHHPCRQEVDVELNNKPPMESQPQPDSVDGDGHHAMGDEIASETHAAQDAFQSMVGEMDVDDFVQPKRTIKRTRDETGIAGTKSWITSNMFDALSAIEINPKLISTQHDKTIHAYSMEIQHSAPGKFHGRTSIRRMRQRRNSMLWHPNNLTMKQIETELDQLKNNYDENVALEQLEQAMATSTEDIQHLLATAKPENLWRWVCRNPAIANVSCTRAFLSNPTDIRTIAYLHAWHRWVVVSTLPRVTTFNEAFESIFSTSPTPEFLSNAFASHAAIHVSTPSTFEIDIMEVELALALFEILLATQTAPYFFDEAWLICATKQPVIWLPIHNIPSMVASDTLWGLLHSPIGHQLVSTMQATCPGGLRDVLAHLQTQKYTYEKGSMVAFVPGTVPTLDMVQPYRM